MHTSVERVLNEIATLEPIPSHVLCESTGATRPWPLIGAVTQNSKYKLRHFIVTVDALNLHRDFDDGRVLIGETQITDAALQYGSEILAEQLIFASVIILTKIDSVPKDVTDAQIQILRRIQPQATIGLSAHAGIQLSQLESTAAPNISNLENIAERFGLHNKQATAQDVGSVIFRDARPFHPQRLFEVCQSQLGTAIYRTKGFLWLASRPAEVLLWQQSGSQISFELTSVWTAEAVLNRYGKLLPNEVEQLKKQLATKHPVFGDRYNTITIIGMPDACTIFANALKSALCTETEIIDWKNGKIFEDPWPKSIKIHQ